ncbi:MAG: UvrD-helicase domain-containing protein [Clostridiales bacterium]|nr:UvrD-helicase domain-containing protein [Clostridiales bacterium]
MKSFAHLNEQQIKAVNTLDGALLVLAGAGSGKTTVLINRIANIIQQKKAYPRQILAITFTNKAAQEMKLRLKNMLGDEAVNVWAHTFHACCMRILRRDIDKIGFPTTFNIFDTGDQKTLIKQCLQTLNFDEKKFDIKSILRQISRVKDELIDPAEFADSCGNDFRMKQISKIYDLYQRRLKENNALDFDDIIAKTVFLFEREPEILERYKNQFKYIMVDEFQDTNHAQYRLICMLTGRDGNLCVVGDDDQSIYRFRGATIENILNFEKQFPHAKVIKLEQNYRSTQNILDAANHVISNNNARKTKMLWTDNGSGEKIAVCCLQNERAEGAFVINKIAKMVGDGLFSYSDFVVLYRMNAQSRVVEEEFIKRNVPYRVVGGLRFHDRKEIKDIFAYLRLAHNHADDISLRRIINVPARKIGKTTMEQIIEIAQAASAPIYDVLTHCSEFPSLSKVQAKIEPFVEIMADIEKNISSSMNIPEFVRIVLQKSGYADMLTSENTIENQTRLENLDELLSIANEYQSQAGEEADLGGFLESMALYADVDSYDEMQDEGVVLMTLHSAKGLEFPVVFMIGMEQNIFPSAQSIMETEQMDEERRLCYVGITRAKQQLFLTHARTRMLFGKTDYNPPSQFLSEIPKSLTSSSKFFVG